MKIGIVGLPNVGKSTLFKALTKKTIDIANYPFCTIDPNVGVVAVPDERLDALNELFHSEKFVPATIEFVDIAGLVKDAHQGEGLGNKFLSHIREVDAIAHVIRNFHDDNIIHVEGRVNPTEDLSTIATELAMADLTTVENALHRLKEKTKAGDKEAIKTEQILLSIKKFLDQGQKPDVSTLSSDYLKLIKSFSLLTSKPELYIENIDEDHLKNFTPAIPNSIPICAKLEAELSELDDLEAKKYLHELGLEKTGLEQLITASYQLLNLITFFTAGPKEAHAWPIKNGTKAPAAAGEIHTDFEAGFIRAEIINWQDLLTCGSEAKAKEKGLMHLEGKDYIMQDGDTAYFHFNK
ncbi:MAG TPA: redox-regulated ATPase YchF [Patescibacteria group bacterium]|nr:redox-regulated ATPase YchF [Patescibacteria group bacterium]